MPPQFDEGGSIGVLHVDDDVGFAELTAEFLHREDERFRVHAAEDIDEGLTVLTEEPIDCVVSDYEMPGTNGLEFLRTVREEYPDLPFILFTGKGSEEIASDAISAGVTDYLQKSGRAENFSLLRNRISNAVERRRATAAADCTRRWYSKLVERSTDIIAVIDDEGDFQYVSPASKSVLGHDPSALLGENAFAYVHPEDHDAATRFFENLLADDGGLVEAELRLRRVDGSWATVLNRGRNLFGDPDVGGVVVYTRDISPLKERERELREARDTIQHLFDGLNDALYIHDFDGNVQAVNERAVEMSGYSRTELESMSLHDLDASAEVPNIEAQMNEVVTTGASTFETAHETSEGREIPVEVSARRISYQGSPAVVGVARDVSERTDLQRRLHHYKQAVESSEDLIAAADEDLRFLFANESYRRYHSLGADELVGTSLRETMGEDTFESSRPYLEAALDGSFVHYEMTRPHPERGDRHLEIRYYPLEDETGEQNGVVASIRDITERKQRELELSRKSSLLDTIFEHVPVHLYVKDTDTRHRYVSRALLSEFGDPDRILGKTDRDLVAMGLTSEEFSRASQQDDLSVIETGDPIIDREEYNPTVDRWFLTSKAPWVDEDGDVIGLIGVTRDITRRKRDQERIAVERDRFVALFENIPDPAVVVEYVEDRPVVTEVNTAFERTFGFSAAELVGQNLDEYIVPESGEENSSEYNASLRAGESIRAEVRRRTKTGVRDFILHLVPLERGEQNVEGYAIYTDITGRRERERELARQNERLDAFASMVSHDLRNPLNVAQGHLEFAREECPDARVFLDTVETAHDRIETLIDGLLTLARQGQTVDELERVDLREVVEDSWNTVPTDGASLDVVESGAVRADRDRLQHLFENLFRNAVDHGARGSLSESDDGQSGAATAVTVRVGLTPAGFFVADDGRGIPESARQSVFEWGYSTRSGGTGLGLAIVREIAAAHGWTVEATESAEGGARFEFRAVERPTDPSD